jgi:hypothetical protein
VREQFEIHRIVERLNAVDKMTWYCGYPSPNWLRAMIIKLYKQMTEIRVHTEKDCQKILQPESDFSPTIQMWYDRIHMYLQLIRLKEGKASNASNIVRFAKRMHIERPVELSKDELEDGLQFCRIRKAGEKLQYLSNESLAKAIITGTYDIPTNLEPATAMILKEIGKLGMKIVNGDNNSSIFGRK